MQNQMAFQFAPMVDIIFILLVFFIVLTVYAQWEKNVPLTLPTADSGITTKRQQGEIILNVNSKGEVFINDRSVSREELNNLLTDVSKNFPDQAVIIRADMDSAYKHFVSVVDVCKSCDIWNIFLATTESNPIKTK